MNYRRRRNQACIARLARPPPADVACEPDAAASKQSQRIGIDAVLDLQDARGQRLRRVVVGNRDRALHHDRPGVGFRNDEMHGSAGNLHAGFAGLTVRDRVREMTAAARDGC